MVRYVQTIILNQYWNSHNFWERWTNLTQEMAVFFQGYITGVIVGSILSITLYRAMQKSGKFGRNAESKPSEGVQ